MDILMSLKPSLIGFNGASDDLPVTFLNVSLPNVVPDIEHDQHLQPSENRKQAAKPRAVLTSEDAMTIFRLSIPNEMSFDDCRSKPPSAVAVARVYSVSEKTIRDIWSGRTW